MADQLKYFSLFWKEYPRKVSKKRAEAAWIKHDCDAIPGRIVEAVQKQRAHIWNGKEQKFIPHPASWLNAGSWEDEIVVPDASYVHPKTFKKADPMELSMGLIGTAKHYNIKTEGLTADEVEQLVWARKYGGLHETGLSDKLTKVLLDW